MKHFQTIAPLLKRSVLVAGLFALTSLTYKANAQDIKSVPAVPTGSVNPGTVLNQFMNAIKPASFTDGWTNEKSNWLSSVGKIKDAASMSSNITSLAKFIKPSMFKSGFSLESLMKTAANVKTMSEAGGLLKTLEGGLKPEAMVSSWAGKRNTWLSALNMLK